ncbi:MAG: hypothetical protein PHT21_11805 [Lachnospiraceae bacterium]|nr:hypothetical protein [Lachnospiraceae bacterium]
MIIAIIWILVGLMNQVSLEQLMLPLFAVLLIRLHTIGMERR